MHLQSQSQKIKVCNSCKRHLLPVYFGVCRSSADGFNYCCKDCRNYRRRRSYQQSLERKETIFPLSENNLKILLPLVAAKTNLAFSVLNMASGEILNGQLYFHPCLRFQIVDSIGRQILEVISACSDGDFIQVVSQILQKKQLRLFRAPESMELYEWLQQPKF